MKLNKGDDSIKMPPIGLLDSVVLELDNGDRMALSVVAINSLQAFRKENPQLMGIPCYAALDENYCLQVFPKADQDTEIRVRYFPLMVEA